MSRAPDYVVNALLIVALLFGGIYLHNKNSQAEHVLCVLRADLQKRRDDSVNYLADLKSGKRAPIPGITQADIQRSILNQDSTLNSLSGLDC